MKKTIGIILIASVTSLFTMGVAKNYFYPPLSFQQNGNGQSDIHLANYSESTSSPDGGGGYVNLEDAAESSSRAVVHIKTETKARAVQYNNPFGDDFFNQFFGGGGQQRMYQQPQQASGSGVIISADGYVVTNNHVVDGADNVTVVLNNKKSYQAKVIGKDPSSDLAVLKINDTNLPFISYGNSDDVKLGQWVLAVGYPLTLETTVTAGIVSAKYRNIGINQSKSGNSAIESFIQTDAAVNPGNSGGALVNARGELIGINSAIASPTGSYAGYSFAIPSNIVKKVVNDMVKYGNVQRAYLGVSYVDNKNASPEQMSAYGLDKVEGIYINKVFEGGSAESAGIKEGDFITRIGNRAVKTGPEMTEQIAQFRPGENSTVSFIRNGKEMTSTINFKNKLGTTDIVKAESSDALGLSMRALTAAESKSLKIAGGIIITDIKSNGLVARQTRMKKTFVITQVNEKNVSTLEDVERILASGEKDIQLGGLYPNYQGIYYYMIKLD